VSLSLRTREAEEHAVSTTTVWTQDHKGGTRQRALTTQHTAYLNGFCG
jgi:hypothetical protein